MNRRMVKAKAARKFHAARRRWWARHPVVIEIRLDFDPAALATALFGVSQAACEAAAAMHGFGEAIQRAGAIDGECTRVSAGGFLALPASDLEAASIDVDAWGRQQVAQERLLEGGRGGGKRYSLAGGGLLRRNLDGSEERLGTVTSGEFVVSDRRFPPHGIGCTCVVERVTKTGSDGQRYQVDVPGPTCAWCERRRPIPRRPDCGACGQPIMPDSMTGTRCGCAPGKRPWSPLMCECTGTGPTCGYCRGHGVP